MLRKVLKYDLKSIWKIWTIAAISSLVVSLIFGFCIRTLDTIESSGNEFIFISCLLGVFVCVIGLAAFFLMGVILPIYRFYKNMFTDEAYLTLTLPVKRETLLVSKLINAIIWVAGTTLVFIIDVIIVMAPIPLLEDGSGSFLLDVFANIGNSLSMIYTAIGGWLIVYIILGILLAVCYMAFSILLFFAIISFVCTTGIKHKGLVGVLIYYALSMVSSVFSSILTVLAELGIGAFTLVSNQFSTGSICGMVTLIILAVICGQVILSTIAYRFTLHRISSKLNLA